MKKLTALFLTSAAFLAGCHSTQTIEPPGEKTKGIEGVHCIYAPVFNGAVTQGVACVVDGNRLEAGKYYNFGGQLLVIRGDVPEKVSIDAGRAKVFVNGNVSRDVRIEASKPENYASETTLMPMPMSCGQNCTTIMLMPMTNTYSTGFTYPADHDPVTIVAGTISPRVDFRGNGSYAVANGQSEVYGDYFIMPAVRQALDLR